MTLAAQIRLALDPLGSVRLAVLFGSQAEGRARPGSDVDIGLRLDPDTPAERGSVETRLGRALGRQLDVIYLDQAPVQLRFDVARYGVLLVASDEDAWPAFRARAMVDWWDWAPLARRIHAAALARLRERNADGQS